MGRALIAEDQCPGMQWKQPPLHSLDAASQSQRSAAGRPNRRDCAERWNKTRSSRAERSDYVTDDTRGVEEWGSIPGASPHGDGEP